MVRCTAIFTGSFACAWIATCASAGTILQPSSVIAQPPLGEFSTDYQVENLTNQSGLSSGYASLADDFDAYLASGPTHDSGTSTAWISETGNPTGDLDFSLGNTYVIQTLALWNFGGGERSNITSFTLLADNNATFDSPTTLGSFTADPNTGPTNAVNPQVFAFPATAASHVRLRITGTHGRRLTGAGEVAFEVAVVPESRAIYLGLVGVLVVAVFLCAKAMVCRRKS